MNSSAQKAWTRVTNIRDRDNATILGLDVKAVVIKTGMRVVEKQYLAVQAPSVRGVYDAPWFEMLGAVAQFSNDAEVREAPSDPTIPIFLTGSGANYRKL